MARGLEAEAVALDGLQLTQLVVRHLLVCCCSAFFASEGRSLSAELADCAQMAAVGSQCSSHRSFSHGAARSPAVPHALGLEMSHLRHDQNSDKWCSHSSWYIAALLQQSRPRIDRALRLVQISTLVQTDLPIYLLFAMSLLSPAILVSEMCTKGQRVCHLTNPSGQGHQTNTGKSPCRKSTEILT